MSQYDEQFVQLFTLAMAQLKEVIMLPQFPQPSNPTCPGVTNMSVYHVQLLLKHISSKISYGTLEYS